MSQLVTFLDGDGNIEEISVATNPPENDVLQSIDAQASGIYARSGQQITALEDLQNTVGQLQAAVNSLEAVVANQSSYTDVIRIDLSGIEDFTTADTLDAIMPLDYGDVEIVLEGGGIRVLPTLPGVPIKARINEVRVGNSTLSEVIGYRE